MHSGLIGNDIDIIDDVVDDDDDEVQLSQLVAV